MNGVAGQRGRGLHWLQALVLLVLLTGAVSSVSVPELGADPVVEAVLERVATRARAVAGRCERPAVATAAVARGAWPRPQPRTRSVQERGLPAPRAPTA